MIVTVYTRHFPECAKRNDRTWRRCTCPKWLYCAEWTPDRRSAKTRTWSRAEELAQRYERGETIISPKLLSEAAKSFLEDKEQQGVSVPWLGKFEHLLNTELIPWAKSHGIVQLSEIGLEQLGEFRKTWKNEPITRKKKQERLRSFFKFCTDHEWLKDNPARRLSPIRANVVPTMPLEDAEFEQLLKGIEAFGKGSCSPAIQAWQDKLEAIILLMRWSGLRVGDASTLRKDRVKDGKLFLYTQKTGTPVWLPLPKSVVIAMDSVKNSNPEYFFWSGRGTVKSATSCVQRAFKRLTEISGVSCHPHQLRDTFAVGLLLKGVPIEDVSILLGHSDIRVTLKHYSPWVRARQEQLEASVRKAWDS